MATAESIIKLAQKYIGVKESPPNSNKCRFTEIYGAIGPWCVMFDWCLFKEANASALFYGGKKTASCGTLMRWAKSVGQWVTSGYKPGDLVMFNFSRGTAPEHVGICESWDGKTMVTIDGNTGSSSESNGGAVMRRSRKPSKDCVICGAFRPKYTASTPTQSLEKPVTITIKQIYKGSKGELVKRLQVLLNYYGYKLSVDGSFGAATDAAVKDFQKKNGLSVDGYVGQKTWQKLMGV